MNIAIQLRGAQVIVCIDFITSIPQFKISSIMFSFLAFTVKKLSKVDFSKNLPHLCFGSLNIVEPKLEKGLSVNYDSPFVFIVLMLKNLVKQVFYILY